MINRMQLIKRVPVDVCLAIKQRLEELGLEQRDLAAAKVKGARAPAPSE